MPIASNQRYVSELGPRGGQEPAAGPGRLHLLCTFQELHYSEVKELASLPKLSRAYLTRSTACLPGSQQLYLKLKGSRGWDKRWRPVFTVRKVWRDSQYAPLARAAQSQKPLAGDWLVKVVWHRTWKRAGRNPPHARESLLPPLRQCVLCRNFVCRAGAKTPASDRYLDDLPCTQRKFYGLVSAQG